MQVLFDIIVGCFYIISFVFFIILIVRLYQVLSIYVMKNFSYLPITCIFKRKHKRYENETVDEYDDDDDITKQKILEECRNESEINDE